MKELSKAANNSSAGSGWWLPLVVAAMGFLLYANTIGNDYAIDDGAVITTNTYVQQGIKGIPGILTTDTWHFENTSLGYYRPLSIVTFAVENQFYPNNPHVSHFVNALLYAFTGFLLCIVLFQIFSNYSPVFSFIVALLFMAHPIHTEVVNNIKNREEILSFLNLLLAIYFLLRPTGSSWKSLLPSCFFYYLALLSKETAMAGVLLIPAILYFTSSPSSSFTQILKRTLPFILLLLLFQWQKYLALGSLSVPHVDDIVSFPYTGFGLKLATAFTQLSWYIKLIFLPFSLSYNYTYDQIPASSWTSATTIIGILLSIILLFLVFTNKKTPLQSGVLIFTLLLLPAIGFVLLMGGILAERFLYAPTLGFCIAVTYLIFKWVKIPLNQPVNSVPGSPVKFLPFAIIILCYSLTTISRNNDWKDDLTLSRHDVNVTPNSCQVHLHYGKKLIDLGVAETSSAKRHAYFSTGTDQLRLAIAINPHYARAYFKLAYAYQSLEENTDSAIYYYNRAIDEAPGYALAYNNLGTLYTKMGRFQLATHYLEKALQLEPGAIDATHNLQLLQQMQNTATQNTDTTTFEFYSTTGIKYAREKNFGPAQEYLLKAVQMQPKSIDALVNLAACYGMMGNYTKSEEILTEAEKLQPDNKSVLQNLATLYHLTGDHAKEKTYRDKLARLSASK